MENNNNEICICQVRKLLSDASSALRERHDKFEAASILTIARNGIEQIIEELTTDDS